MKSILLAAAAAALCLAATPAVLGAPAWITVGDAAWKLLAEHAPDARTLSSRGIGVDVPVRRGSAQLTRATETVHAVELDDSRLDALSQAVHETLHRCGGYVRHASQAEALAVLHQLQSSPLQTAAPSYTIDDSAIVTPMLPLLQESQVLSTIQQLSDFQNRIYSTTHGVAASDWLTQQWTTLAGGRRWVQVSQVTHTGLPQKSVKLRITGKGNPREIVVLGAHLDSIASNAGETTRAPGADDDASGVAALTEIIRVLMDRNYRPQRSIEFFAYAAEEIGLVGSQQIATSYKSQKKKVVGVLQLDMTAYQGDPADLWIFTDYTNTAQNQFLADLAANYLPQLTVAYDRCGYGCSDHASWTGKGFVASFPFEASFAHDNHNIHTANDTIANFGNQAKHAIKFTQLGLAYAVELGSD